MSYLNYTSLLQWYFFPRFKILKKIAQGDVNMFSHMWFSYIKNTFSGNIGLNMFLNRQKSKEINTIIAVF